MRQADPASEDLLRQAAYEGNEQNVEALLGMGVNVNAADAEGRTALVFAAFNGHSNILLELLEAGDFTALMHAAAEGHLEVVKVLLANGADPGLKDIDGDDAVAFAQQAGHVEVADFIKGSR